MNEDDMSYGSLLAQFKKEEKPSSLIPLLSDDQLRNAVIAWESTPVKMSGGADVCTLKSENDQWEWLWKDLSVNFNSFSIIAGCNSSEAQKLFIRLKGLRLIYPDNTINTMASKYLTSLILQELQKGKKKPAGRPPVKTGKK